MENPKWTPGPWTFEPPYFGFSAITGPNGELIFGIAAGGEDEKRPADVCEANARLIAAAPDLYEACQLALNAFERGDAIDWDILARALAKARGEQ